MLWLECTQIPIGSILTDKLPFANKKIVKANGMLSFPHGPRRDNESRLVHPPWWGLAKWVDRVFDLSIMVSLSVSLGRTLRFGTMQLSTCLRSASCWIESPGRCCCCWRPTTCWGALRPSYRPDPPPRPSLTCPAAAYVPWPGQKDCDRSSK